MEKKKKKNNYPKNRKPAHRAGAGRKAFEDRDTVRKQVSFSITENEKNFLHAFGGGNRSQGISKLIAKIKEIMENNPDLFN